MSKQETKDMRIKTIAQLKELAKRDSGLDCYILLNGRLRSSKHITITLYSNCGPRGWFVSDVSLSIAIPTCDHEPNSPPPAGCSRRSMI